MTSLDCELLGDNHSKDKVTLYAGYEKPYRLCGYHHSKLTQEDYNKLNTTEGEQE